jgi:hypothetical protein
MVSNHQRVDAHLNEAPAVHIKASVQPFGIWLSNHECICNDRSDRRSETPVLLLVHVTKRRNSWPSSSVTSVLTWTVIFAAARIL